MITFQELYSEFEKTINISYFEEKYKKDRISTRFLLIRSLDTNDLKQLLIEENIQPSSQKQLDLMEDVYNSSLSIDSLLKYIEKRRAQLIDERKADLEGLPELLNKLPVVNAGVRDDKVDSIIKSFVRNKNIKEYTTFQEELQNKIIPRITNYILWSYFNQTSNDLIELIFLKHDKIIPTLRKIHDIDFFVKFDKNTIIPFDLKVTHISDSFFDLSYQGITKNTDTNIFDDYTVYSSKKTELAYIKEFYKSLKSEYNLPNYGKLSKAELINNIESIDNNIVKNFIQKTIDKHNNLIPKSPDELHKLEWWNYKYQGERLFSNNNRIFLFLALKDKFIDGRILKGKIEVLENIINKMLNEISLESVHTIKYRYEKDKEKIGNYQCKAFSTIYTE